MRVGGWEEANNELTHLNALWLLRCISREQLSKAITYWTGHLFPPAPKYEKFISLLQIRVQYLSHEILYGVGFFFFFSQVSWLFIVQIIADATVQPDP